MLFTGLAKSSAIPTVDQISRTPSVVAALRIAASVSCAANATKFLELAQMLEQGELTITERMLFDGFVSKHTLEY